MIFIGLSFLFGVGSFIDPLGRTCRPAAAGLGAQSGCMSQPMGW